MNQEELRRLNLGESLDNIMNIDPRGYGVCKILYKASREYTKSPLTMNAATKLCETLKEGDIVYLMTGFVLRPFKKAETDGIVGTMLLARALVKAFNIRPVIICQEENIEAVKNLSYTIGLHYHDSIEGLFEYPKSLAGIPFTKDLFLSEEMADELIAKGEPKAVIAIECPGANYKGVYHNSVGKDITELEAKSDILFEKLKEKGVLNIAIGDLGNELGMGTLKSHLEEYIPRAAKGTCDCPCKGGLASKVSADNIITATVSDFGTYGLIAALAYLKDDINIMHDKDKELEALKTASRSGMIDMYGDLIPAIDGCNASMICSIVNLMREVVDSSLKLKETCSEWFDEVINLGFFDENINLSEVEKIERIV